MSNMTNIVVFNYSQDEELLKWAQKWFLENELHELIEVSRHWQFDKRLEACIYLGAYNYLDWKAWLNRIAEYWKQPTRWRRREEEDDWILENPTRHSHIMELLIMREHEAQFWVCRIDRSGIKPYPFPPEEGL